MDETRTKRETTEAEMEELRALRIKTEQQENDPRALAHIVSWDKKHNRPVVGGMITHPVTGEVVKGGEWITSGPPDVDCIWHNWNSASSDTAFTSLRASLSLPVDKVFVAVAEHVRDGHYSIVSINVSAYSFVIICNSELTPSELGKLHRNMYSK
jgi:hypothetical protein